MEKFDKRIFTFTSLLKTTGDLLISVPAMIIATLRGLVSHAFSEKIMLAVSAVNGCRFCSWFHAKNALKSGSDMSQIEDIMKMELGDNISKDELVALAFAQHYAESNRNPDPETFENFKKFYGKKKSKDIMTFIKFIYFGNISGNTFDAFLHRLKGVPAPKSNPIFEFFFFILSAPILLPQIKVVERFEKKNKDVLGKHKKRSVS